MEHITTVQIDVKGTSSHLDSREICESLLDAIVVALGLTKLNTLFHKFSPQGLSSIYMLSESHIALHTWPETSNGYITISTCKDDTMNESIIESILHDYDLEITSFNVIGRPLTV